MSPADFKAEVGAWAARLRVAPRRVEVRALKRKWASCSPAGRVIFSRELLAQTRRLRTYVIVHELLHLRIANHGKVFRQLLRLYAGRADRIKDARTLNGLCR